MTDAIRVERAHRYEWWGGGADGTVEVLNDDGVTRICIETNPPDQAVNGGMVSLPMEESGLEIRRECIPALIAALTSYHQRLNAAENEQ